MTTGIERHNTLLHGVFSRYFIPIALSSTYFAAQLILEKVIVGSFLGETNLAVLHLCSPVVYIFDFFFALFAYGAATKISIYKGERDSRRANEMFTLASAALLAAGILIMLLGFVFLKPIVVMFAGDSGLAELIEKYLRWMILLPIPHILLLGYSLFMNADNHPRLASIMVLIACSATVSCQFVFVGLLGMGIGGASLGTLVGFSTAALLIIPYLSGRSRTLRFVFRIQGRAGKLFHIIRSGSAISLMIGLDAPKLFILNMLLMEAAGPSALAVYAVCLACAQFVDMFKDGGGKTIMPLVGMLYGERDYSGIRVVMRRAYTVILSCSALVSLGMVLFPSTLLGVFGVTDESAVSAIYIYAGFIILFVLLSVHTYYLNTIGQARLATIVSLADGFFVLLSVAFVMTTLFGATGFWFSFLINKIIMCSALALITLFYINKKSPDKRRGILSLPDSRRDAKCFEATATAIEDVVGLSDKIIDFCTSAGCLEKKANLVGIAIEEMGVNSIRHNLGRKKWGGARAAWNGIDVLVYVLPDEILVSFRDAQPPFDPTKYSREEEDVYEIHGIALLRKIASHISYEYNLGLNCTIITINREQAASE